MIVRDLTPEDIYYCYSISEQLWGTDILKGIVQELWEVFQQYTRFKLYYIVAEDNGEVVGFAGFRRVLLAPDTWEHTWSNVRKDQQGKGVGQLLAQERFSRIRALGGKVVITASKTPSWPAKNGFQPGYEFEGWHYMFKKL